MEIINVVSFTLLCIFGMSYFAKMVMLCKKNNIRANVLGKGYKPKATLLVERCLKVMTFLGIGIWIINAFLPKLAWNWFFGLFDSLIISLIGLSFSLVGVALFITAMVFMKTSWRAGIDKSTQSSLITNGIYKYSRNPAFLGFDLMFVGVALTFGNVVSTVLAILIIIGLHLQIIQEERHMADSFSQEYAVYASKTPRYFLF